MCLKESAFLRRGTGRWRKTEEQLQRESELDLFAWLRDEDRDGERPVVVYRGAEPPEAQEAKSENLGLEAQGEEGGQNA